MNKKTLPYIIGIPNMAVGMLWAMNLVLIPMLVGTITENNTKLGVLVSMGALTGCFVQYIAGMLSDRSNLKMGKRKPFMLIGVIVAVVFMCLMPFLTTYVTVFACAFIFYFSLNFFQGPYYSLIPEIVDNNQLGLANGFSKIISVLGSGIVFVAGPMLWNINHSYPFFLAAALALTAVLVTSAMVKESPGKVEEKPSKVSFDFMKLPSVRKLYFAVFFIFLGYGCITPFFTKYCVKYLNLTEGVASTGLLILTIAGAFCAWPIGVLADKLERRMVLIMGTLIFGLCLAAGALVKGTIGLYAVLAVMGIGFIAIQITIYTILAEIVPPARLGEFMGIFNFFISAGQFLANLAMGVILDAFGFGVFFPVAAAFMFIAVIILFFSKFDKYSQCK